MNQYQRGGANTSEPRINVKNRTLFHGDNLEFLRGINTGTIQLIATDPPFNKNKDFYATPDSLSEGAKFTDRWSWEKDVHEGWLDSIKDDWPNIWQLINATRKIWGDDMAAFLCWLGVRLMEMHRVLRDDGSLYLHIDHTAHAYVKVLLDAIFGKKNFRNEIVWHYGLGAFKSSGRYPRKHDTLLFYAKSHKVKFNVLRGEPTESMLKKYCHEDENGRYMLSYGKKYYMKGGKPYDSVWDIPSLSPTDKKERTGYPTQKPLALYERVIKASSNKNDFVLDPFCGCATTPVAAEKLERQWIGMDIWEEAHNLVLERLQKEGLAAPEGEAVKGQRVIAFKEIIYETNSPIRTDNGEVAAEDFELKTQRVLKLWQRLSHKQMREILTVAQYVSGSMNDVKVGCAGCGRELEVEFMHLDHVSPKSSERGSNFITNRVLLCEPCNRRKSNKLTIEGLQKENRKTGWMKDYNRARESDRLAANKAEWVRENCDTKKGKEFIKKPLASLTEQMTM